MRGGSKLLYLLLVVLALCGRVKAQIAGQGDLLVNLDARDPSAGTESWRNLGTLGAFVRVGAPSIATLGGVKAVMFDGKKDAYRGPVTVAATEGSTPRTIAVWAWNPTINSPEETVVSWGRRGGPDGTLLSLNWGSSTAYGGATHWAADLGWNGVPKPGRWHYLVYTYDGKVARLYEDTLEKSSRTVALQTAAGFHINLAAQNRANGEIQFVNEFDGTQQAGSLAIASVQICARAMSPEEIGRNFDAEAARYGAVRSRVLAQGVEKVDVGPFTLSLLRATQTAASLSPRGAAFDFTPGDRLAGRIGDGYYHLGDFTLRARLAGGTWVNASSATSEREKLQPVRDQDSVAAADLTSCLGTDCPVSVVRTWASVDGALALRFRLTNRMQQPVEIGAFGAAMVFNNLITGRSLEETHEKCSFCDPYIGGEAGYLQVTRLNGQGPALLVLPEKGTSFEAYRPLYDDPTPRDVTFEGFYEWMTLTAAYATNDWKQVRPWNQPTSRMLQPGESITYGYRFVLSPAIRNIERILIAEKRPVAIGIPGYVVATDQTARLFVHSAAEIRSAAVEPANALQIKLDSQRTPNGWRGCTVSGVQTGRCRLTITFADGMRQQIHYFVTPPETEQVRQLGRFHATNQWFTDPNDPFHRTFSFLPFNRETGQMVVQHPHSWFAGLSDEIGAGASVAMAMKNLGQPNADEIALLEKYVSSTLWGHVQNPDYSVRASLFFYEPAAVPGYRYTVNEGWNKERTETTWRSFNYPHVAAVYWALYHLARDYQGLTHTQSWDWYLDHAYRTSMAIRQFAPGYAAVGLMVGSVFPEIMRDLRREGWNDKANALEAYMKQRETHWAAQRYPFGSEMPWDSTGQEEIYTWCRYFGADDKAQVTLDAILGYMPTIPNWAYNGAGRRYFDAPVNGTRWPQIVRMTNHYGSSINAIPVLDAFRRNSDDLYLLRVGYAGMDQVLANIDAAGFGSYGFDADAAILQFDPYTADYGIAFYGYARNAGSYVVQNPEFGWLGFGCEVQEAKNEIRITPRDGFRKQVFLAPLGLWLTLDAGTFQSVVFDPGSRTVQIRLAPATPSTPTARLRLETGSRKSSLFAPAPILPMERGAYVVPLSDKPSSLTLK